MLGVAARAWPWLKLALGIFLLLLLGWLVDWAETWRTLRDSDLRLVALSATLILLALIVSTIKWKLLARIACGRLRFLSLLRAYWMGSFVSNYLPSNVGGDVVRILVVQRIAPLAPLAGSVLVERLIGVTALGLISTACLALRPAQPWSLNLALWLLVAAIVCGTGTIILAGNHLVRGGTALLARLPDVVRRRSTKLGRFGEAVAAYRGAPAELAVAGAWSCVFYGLLVLFQVALLRSVGSPIGLAQVALVAPLVPLVSLLPVTANGLGLTEGAFVLFYTQMGVPAEQAFAAALLRRLVTIGVTVPGGLMWLAAGRVGAAIGERRT
jgi:uncharacterized protein (TIRG00374 family)